MDTEKLLTWLNAKRADLQRTKRLMAESHCDLNYQYHSGQSDLIDLIKEKFFPVESKPGEIQDACL